MAFSSRQKQEIIRYLGWPGKTLIEASTHYNTIVNSRLINLNADIEAQAVALLARLSALDSKIDKASCRVSAVKVDAIELNPDELRQLRLERKKFIRELSNLLDIAMIASSGSMVGVSV